MEDMQEMLRNSSTNTTTRPVLNLTSQLETHFNGGNATIYYMCAPNVSGTAALVVSLLALPFHILIIKIIMKDIGLSLPHHRIVLTLTISDAVQIFSASFVSSIANILQSTTESVTCRILRDSIVFTGSLTIVVSSLALTTFAVERMIICMHFLKYRRIFQRTRVTRLLRSYWLVGMILAAIAAATNDARKTETSVNETTSFQIICSLIVIPSALIITVIYFRIFLFSRGKIVRVVPNSIGSKLRDITTFKKKQFRIASVAGVVCMSYVICMVPMAINFFLELIGATDNNPSLKNILISFALVNTLTDPIIYGFGMVQTRRILIRTVKKIFT